MNVRQNISLKSYNTFGIDATTKYFGEFSSIDELPELLSYSPNRLILGGGSNILLTGNIDGIVLKNNIRDISVVRETEDHFFVKAGAGENWNRFVQYCLSKDYAGVENLSLIPGNVGASPMQNIGAYGIEIKDVFDSLEAWHIEDKALVSFDKKDCEFGYRESVFKNKLKGQFIIVSVTYKLSKVPVYNISYGAIEEELSRLNRSISIRTIAQAVINIRSSKLPDPSVIGNAGSFFKNPTIPKAAFELLQKKYPTIPGYFHNEQEMKLAAGWLIEQCGWKGFRRGDAGCHRQQALVLVNYGNASGNDILSLSEEIMQTVLEKFNVQLEREVNII